MSKMIIKVKNLVTWLFTFAVLFWFWFAADGNCNLIGTESYQDIASIIANKYSNIIDEESLTKILDNLQVYCCKTEIACETQSERLNTPQSIILFDHILDVYLRRLDAVQANNNWQKDLLYSLTPDPVGLERREFVNEKWTSTDTNNPLIVSNTYKKYWTLSSNATDNIKWWEDEADFRKTDEEIEEINENFVNWPLINRYQNACEIATIIYFDLWWDNQVEYNDETVDVKNTYNKCKDLVKERIESENTYMRNVLQIVWNKALENSLESYMSDFFTQNRLTTLLGTIEQAERAFFSVNRWVSTMINQCS